MFTCEVKKNEGTQDRAIRLGSGLFILIAAILELTGTVQFLAFIVGALLIGTGVIGWCGLYDLLKINTLGKRVKPSKKK